jgi:hypothetical protein
MKTAYICDNCHKASWLKTWIFHCIECGKEICENCMHGYATCKECAEGMTEEELEDRFNEQRGCA